VGRALGAEPVAGRQEVGLKDRFEDQLGRRHHHPIPHRGIPSGLVRPGCPGLGI
jgi:hypothetical protein